MAMPTALSQQITALTRRGRQARKGETWLAALQELLALYKQLPSHQGAGYPP
jgi:hypothetical protein